MRAGRRSAETQVLCAQLQLSPQRHSAPQLQAETLGDGWQPHWQSAPAHCWQVQEDCVSVFMMIFLLG
jgi:hypothetical protein